MINFLLGYALPGHVFNRLLCCFYVVHQFLHCLNLSTSMWLIHSLIYYSSALLQPVYLNVAHSHTDLLFFCIASACLPQCGSFTHRFIILLHCFSLSTSMWLIHTLIYYSSALLQPVYLNIAPSITDLLFFCIASACLPQCSSFIH